VQTKPFNDVPVSRRGLSQVIFAGGEMMRRFCLSLVAAVAVCCLVSPANADHNCGEFAGGCCSGGTSCMTQAIIEANGGTYFAAMDCNTATGTCTGAKTSGLSIVCSPGVSQTVRDALLNACPTVSEWGLLILALLVITTGAIMLKRQAPTARA